MEVAIVMIKRSDVIDIPWAWLFCKNGKKNFHFQE